MTRKCPKNNCPHVYLRLTKEVSTLKKEIICLKCQHVWSSAAKYVQKIPVGNSEELASLKEIADELHKKYEEKELIDAQPIFINPLPKLTDADIEQMKKEGVELQEFEMKRVEPSKKIKELDFTEPLPFLHERPKEPENKLVGRFHKEKKKERNVPKPQRKRAIVVKKSRTKQRPRVVDGDLEHGKEKSPIKGDFKFEKVNTKIVRVMPHAPLINKPVIKRKKWFKPWTWFN